MGDFDQAQSPRLGQRVAPENPGVRVTTFGDLPEVAYKGQIVYLSDLNVFLLYDGEAWQSVTGGSGGVTVTGSRIFVQSTDPRSTATVDVGDMWFNPTTQLLKTWSGTAWVDQKITTGAADGIVITGSIFRTATSGNRVEIGDDGGIGYIKFKSEITDANPSLTEPGRIFGSDDSLTLATPSTWDGSYISSLSLRDEGSDDGVTGRGDGFAQLAAQNIEINGDTTQVNQPMVLRYKTANLNVPTGTNTDVAFSGGDTADVNFLSNDIDFQVPSDGVYMVVASVGWSTADGTGRRQLMIDLNGVPVAKHAHDGTTVTSNTTQIHAMVKCVAEDNLKIIAFQNSGVTLQILGDSTLSYLQIYKLG